MRSEIAPSLGGVPVSTGSVSTGSAEGSAVEVRPVRRRVRRSVRQSARQRFFRVSRWLHVYTSTALFGLLFFFCLTGIFLNHGWYGENPSASIESLPLDDELRAFLPTDGVPDTRGLAAALDERFALGVPGSVDIDLEIGEIVLGYDVPAGYATVMLDLAGSVVEIERQRGTMVGVLNDLHKGRHSGAAWGWLIDASAVAMLVFAVTGVVILFQNKKMRVAGLWATGLGLLTPLVFYFLFVPRLGA